MADAVKKNMDEQSPLEVEEVERLFSCLAIQDVVLSGVIKMTNAVHENDNEQSPLEALNDDVLNHLFTFLEVKDVIRMHLVSHRFLECAKRWMSKHEIEFSRHAQTFHDMVPSEFSAIFGNYIKRMCVRCPFEYNDLLGEYMDSVEYMRIVFCKDDIGQVSFIGRMQSLRYLRIENWTFSPDMNFFEEVIKLTNLERLCIRDILGFTGHRLSEFRKLNELDLLKCSGITTEHFIKAFLANRDLTRINIHLCPTIGPEAYRCMAQESRLIESLEFDACTLLKGTFIPGLNNLKQLIIHFVTMDNSGAELILSGYSETIGGTLKSLKCIACSNLSFPKYMLFPSLTELIVTGGSLGDRLDVLLHRFCKSFPRLEKINLNYENYDVTQDAVLAFFRQSKSLVFARLPIRDCFNVRFYKELVSVRNKLNITEPLKLVVTVIYPSNGYTEIVALMEGDEYGAYRKLVDIDLELIAPNWGSSEDDSF